MGRRTIPRATLATTQAPVVAGFLAARGSRRDAPDRDDLARGSLRVVNAAGDSDTPAEIYIYEEISDWWGICAQDVVDALKTITADAVDVHINSPGGDVFDALAIYQVLLSHPATINVYIDGLAASAASYIAQAGDTVRIGSAAMVMIHDAWGWAVGNAADMAATSALLDKISANLANVYATRAGGTADEWRARMLVNNGEGTWYTGQEAVDAGLADEVIDAGKRRKCAGEECGGCPECAPDAPDGDLPADRIARAAVVQPEVEPPQGGVALGDPEPRATPAAPAAPVTPAAPAEDVPPAADAEPPTAGPPLTLGEPDSTSLTLGDETATDPWDELVAQLADDATRGMA